MFPDTNTFISDIFKSDETPLLVHISPRSVDVSVLNFRKLKKSQ